MPGATLSEVATAAGVSVSTASRVLNRAPNTIPISEATQAKVRAAAERLRYVPHAAARNLRTGASRSLGVLGTHPRQFADFRSFSGEIMVGLLQAGVELGYHITLLTGWEEFNEAGDPRVGLGGSDGMLVLNCDLSTAPRHADAIQKCHVPVVYALEYPEDDAATYTAPDDRQGGRLAVEQLIARGHRRIGFVRGPNWAGIFGRRQEGWAHGLQMAGVDPDEDWVFYDVPSPKRVRGLGLTAFVAAHPGWGFNSQRVLKQAGISADFIAFGHTDVQGRPLQQQDAVVHDLRACVANAVHQLVALIEEKAVERQVLNPMTFVAAPTGRE